MSRNLTTAQRIFKKFYTVSVPRIHLVNAAQDDTYGTVQTGNEVIDEYQTKNAHVVSEQCIARLAMIHEQAGPGTITFARPRETVEIYQAIQEHIAAWNYESTNNPNSRMLDKVLEELVVLDNFAEWVWKIARKYVPVKPVVQDDNSMVARLRNRGFGRLLKPVEVPVEQSPQALLPVDHARQTTEMEERSFNRRSGWL